MKNACGHVKELVVSSDRELGAVVLKLLIDKLLCASDSTCGWEPAVVLKLCPVPTM
jgi:hypothetical protein